MASRIPISICKRTEEMPEILLPIVKMICEPGEPAPWCSSKQCPSPGTCVLSQGSWAQQKPHLISAESQDLPKGPLSREAFTSQGTGGWVRIELEIHTAWKIGCWNTCPLCVRGCIWDLLLLWHPSWHMGEGTTAHHYLKCEEIGRKGQKLETNQKEPNSWAWANWLKSLNQNSLFSIIWNVNLNFFL